jgi:serine/threonine-protein kinase RsbW
VQLELALSLPREQRSVPVARHLVRAAMRTLGVDADCTSDVEVALSEACTNGPASRQASRSRHPRR